MKSLRPPMALNSIVLKLLNMLRSLAALVASLVASSLLKDNFFPSCDFFGAICSP